jgi:hypothetical protein
MSFFQSVLGHITEYDPADDGPEVQVINQIAYAAAWDLMEQS